MVSTKAATSRTIAERRKKIRSAIRNMSRIAASRVGNARPVPLDNHSPIILGRRVVVRSQVPIPVKPFVALHKLYKEDSIRATKVLSGVQGEPTRMINVAMRCAIQELWEDRLKTTAQLTGLLPPDSELTRPTQELFEQFWKAHGYPNDDEQDLLARVGNVDVAVVDAWFVLKDCRLRTYRLLQEKMKACVVNTLLGQKDWRHIAKQELKIKKPYTRH